MNQKVEALRALLNQAEEPVNDGFAENERGGRAVSALVKAEQDLAAFEAAAVAHAAETDEEALRAELRRRIAAFIEADLGGASDEELGAIASAARPQ